MARKDEMAELSSNGIKEAAGGLLWRGTGALVEIALVHRHRYDDWTLPKGKPKPGESPLETALREVREETGYTVTVLGFVGAIAYETSKSVKRVRFWSMTPKTEARQAIDKTEVTETVWLRPGDACQQLTYPLERALVETWMEESIPGGAGQDCGKRTFRQWFEHWWKLRDIAYQNLRRHLPVQRREFDGL